MLNLTMTNSLKMKPLPDIEVLRELLTYCPESGVLRWKVNSKRRKAGDIAGWSNNGYIVVTISQRSYRAHRIAWALYYGEDPELHIDHKNGDRSDNRIANLRLATRSENNYNIGVRSDNTTGHRGVTYRPERQKYQAYININGRSKNLGRYDFLEDAISARLDAEAKYNIFVRE